MIRKDLYFTQSQIEALQKLSKETGLSVSELIRRAIDFFLSAEVKNNADNNVTRSKRKRT